MNLSNMKKAELLDVAKGLVADKTALEAKVAELEERISVGHQLVADLKAKATNVAVEGVTHATHYDFEKFTSTKNSLMTHLFKVDVLMPLLVFKYKMIKGGREFLGSQVVVPSEEFGGKGTSLTMGPALDAKVNNLIKGFNGTFVVKTK